MERVLRNVEILKDDKGLIAMISLTTSTSKNDSYATGLVQSLAIISST